MRGLMFLSAGLVACGSVAPSPEVMSIAINPEWAEIPGATELLASPLIQPYEGIHILEGNASLVSSLDDDYGLVLSDQRNDLAAITSQYVRSASDFPGILVVFTQFADRASPSPAYFLPIFNDTDGTGMGNIDKRDVFGVSELEGFVNMQRAEDHGENLMSILIHEIAHRHLAYMRVQTESSTMPLDLTGREGAHWHAAFNSQGSFLEGYEWRESGRGRFVSIAKQERLAPIDLYGLGLLAADELTDLFFIKDARVQSGATLPAAADVPIGTVVTGTRIDFSSSDLVATLGTRPFEPNLEVGFLLLTTPGETAGSSTSISLAHQLNELRLELEQEWLVQTNGRGRLITTRAEEMPLIPPDAGRPMPVAPTSDCECQCNPRRSFSAPTTLLLLCFAFGLSRRRKLI